MDDQRLRVADVGQQREDLDAVDEPATGFEPTLDTEGNDAAEAAREVPLRQLVARVRLEARVTDPAHLRSDLEPPRHRERVLAVPGDAQGQRLQALEEQEGVERAEGSADVAQALNSQLENEGEVARDPT